MAWDIHGEDSYHLLMPIKKGFIDFIGDFRGFQPDIDCILIPRMRSWEKGEGAGFKLWHVNYVLFISFI